jgi:hypothetical protein
VHVIPGVARNDVGQPGREADVAQAIDPPVDDGLEIT